MRIAAAALLLFLLTGLLACEEATPPPSDDLVDSGDQWSQIQAEGQGQIRVLYVSADGWAYRDSQGTLTGVTVEIIRDFDQWVEAHHDVRLDVEFVGEQDWSCFYQRVVEGEGGVFGIGNVTITEDRRQELSFSPPYLSNLAVLISHEAVEELEDLDDVPRTFAGKSALAFEGTLHQQRLEAIRDSHAPELGIAYAGSNDDIIRRVSEGGYFAYVDAYNYWRARSQGAPLKRHPVGDDPGEEFGIIMPLGSDWAPLMDEFFQADGGYTQSKRYRQLLRKHLGEDVAELLHPAKP